MRHRAVNGSIASARQSETACDKCRAPNICNAKRTRMRVLFVLKLRVGLPMSVAKLQQRTSLALRSRNGDHRVVHRDRIIKVKHPAIDVRRGRAGSRTNAGAG
jgi:hypothetical protein